MKAKSNKAKWARRIIYPLTVVAVALTLSSVSSETELIQPAAPSIPAMNTAIVPSDYPQPGDPNWRVDFTASEWKKRLTADQYHVLRNEGTEPPFQGACLTITEPGTYVCAGCHNILFRTQTKFDSGTGWPSFFEPVAPHHIGTRVDRKMFVPRTEVHCGRCDGHLGHVFEDGPPPTNLRYCMNSVAMIFIPEGQPLPELVFSD